MTTFLLGAMAMGCLVVAAFFLRFFQETRDRLFLYFGLSFLIEAANRTYFALGGIPREDMPIYYLVRLLAYLLILWAILEKNLPRRTKS